MMRLSVDAILFNDKGIILVRRNYPPYEGYFCLPGGLVEENEKLHEAISREVKEEIGLDVKFTKEDYFTYYDEPSRDPRFRNITHVFYKKINDLQEFSNFNKREVKEVRFFLWEEIPDKLGFDHSQIIKDFKIWKGIL